MPLAVCSYDQVAPFWQRQGEDAILNSELNQIKVTRGFFLFKAEETSKASARPWACLGSFPGHRAGAVEGGTWGNFDIFVLQHRWHSLPLEFVIGKF